MTRLPNLCQTDRATVYAQSVVDGKIIAGSHVRAACQRHIDDLLNADKRGLVFDTEKSQKVYNFFEKILKLNGGKFEGKPFVLHESQAFILGSLFGWVWKESGKRRFRRAYIEIGKGNGKSPLVGGIGIYGMIADGEARAEIYAAASKRDQAMILFRDARAMVEQSPALKGQLVVTGGDHTPNIAFVRMGSFFRPLSNEKGKSGTRPHFALCDEVHEHPDRETIDMLERGFKGREQPLLVMITNSGYDKTTTCWEEHEFAVNVAHRVIEDDSHFSFVCSLDKGDDPLNDPSCWIKANPLLGVTITEQYIAGVVKQARDMPGKRNGILRLHFCVWTDAESVWMAREAWERCERKDFNEAALEGQRCYGGLDLSSKRDLTAFARVWPQDDGTFDAVVDFWTPKDTIRAREDADRVPYRTWVNEGYLLTTPSSTVDYNHVVAYLGEKRDVEQIAFDRWRMDVFRDAMEAQGVTLPLIEHGQGFKDMAIAVDALEAAILNGKLRVKYNPVLRWNVAGTVIDTDPAGNRKFAKNKSTGRIDGVVALAMAMTLATKAEVGVNLDDFINNAVIL